MSDRSVTVRLRAVITDYQRAMKTAAGEAQGFTKTVQSSFGQLNKDVGQLGSELTRKVSLPLVGLGVGALKLASDFETAFAQMVGLAGVAGSEVDGLRESVLKLSHETATSPQKLAEAMYFIRSSGIDAAHAMDVLTASAKASAAGLGDPAVVARTVSAALNAYGDANLSAAHATDVLVAGIRQATFEPDALAASLGTVIATASSMGISFDQLVGTLAVLSRTGLDASEATTALNAVLATLQNNTPAATALLKEHGLTLEQLRNTAAGPGGVVAAMRMLDTAFAGNDQELSTIIPNIRAFRGAMTILAQDAGDVDKVLQDVTNSAGSLDEAFAAVKKTKAFEIKQGIVDTQIALTQLGAALAPLAADFAQTIGGIAAVFGALPKPIQEVILYLGLIAAATGPVMKGFSLLADVAGPVIKLIVTKLVALRAEMIAAQVAGATYGQALRQMAGGIAQTAAVAGPAAILIAGLALTMRDNADAARAAKEQVLALADAIKEAGSVSGGVSKAIASIAQQSSVFASSMSAAGVTVQDVTAALAHGGDAWDSMRQKIIDGAKATGMSELQWRSVMAVLDSLPSRISGATAHLDDLDKTGASAASSADQVAAALAKVGISADGAAGGVSSIGGAMETAANTAEVAANSISRFLSIVDSLYGSTFDVGNAQQGFADALANVDSATTSSGGSTVDLTSKQRGLERATKDVAKAQQALMDAEQALADARKGPTARDKKDASLDVRDSVLGLAEAKKAVADAQKAVAAETKKGSKGDVAGASLHLKEAQLALERAQLRVTDAQDAQNKVLHSGEETSDKVKTAVQAVTDAQEHLTEATQAQTDAEAELTKGGGGGPVADHARQIRGAVDAVTESGKKWIAKLIEMGAPTAETTAAIDEQAAAVKRMMDRYGDPDGNIAKYLGWLDRIRTLLLDAKFHTDFNAAAVAIGGQVGAPIPSFLGSDSTGTPGRAGGGMVSAGATYRVNERGEELLTMGGKPGYITSSSQLASMLGSPMTSAGVSPGGDLMVRLEVDSSGIMPGFDLDRLVTNAVARYAKRTGGPSVVTVRR